MAYRGRGRGHGPGWHTKGGSGNRHDYSITNKKLWVNRLFVGVSGLHGRAPNLVSQVRISSRWWPLLIYCSRDPGDWHRHSRVWMLEVRLRRGYRCLFIQDQDEWWELLEEVILGRLHGNVSDDNIHYVVTIVHSTRSLRGQHLWCVLWLGARINDMHLRLVLNMIKVIMSFNKFI